MVQIKTDINIIDMHNIDSPKTGLEISNNTLSVVTDKKISMLPLGVVTRFNNPVSEQPQMLNKGNRRAFSWMNSNNCAKTQLSFTEWKALCQKHKHADVGDFDHPDTKAIEDLTASETNLEKSEDLEFEAVLFATDNDYLEHVKTRGFFKANAVNSDDIKLFEMPAVEDVPPVRYSIDEIRGIFNFFII